MFQIGSPVYATDGLVGTLQYIVMYPETQEISDLVVKGELFAAARVVSARHVDHVDEDGGIHLAVDKAFVRRARKFIRDEFTEPDEAAGGGSASGQLYWQDIYGITTEAIPEPVVKAHITTGVDENGALIGKGSRVFTRLGERVGTVDHVVVDKDARKALYIVVRLPGIRRRRVVASASQVKEWQSDAVVLDMDRDDLYALPPFVPAKRDATLAQLVRQAIAALGVDIEHLSVFVDNGHVLLRGHSASQNDRRRVEAAARSVSGVISVTNEITTDKELEVLVQQRLLADPVASLYPIDVIVRNRIATVMGKVPSQTVHEIILRIVRNTDGVVSVIDEMGIDAQAFQDEGEAFPEHWIVSAEEGVPAFVPAPQEP